MVSVYYADGVCKQFEQEITETTEGSGRCRLERGEFFQEDRLFHFEPTIDFRQDASECKVFHPFGKACQDTHDDAASLRSRFGLDGTSLAIYSNRQGIINFNELKLTDGLSRLILPGANMA